MGTEPYEFPGGFSSWTDFRNWQEVQKAIRTRPLREIPVPMREEPPRTAGLRRLDDPPHLEFEDASGAIVLELDEDRLMLALTETSDLLAMCVRALLRSGVPAESVRSKVEAALGGWASVDDVGAG